MDSSGRMACQPKLGMRRVVHLRSCGAPADNLRLNSERRVVEAAGVEPASEGASPQKSTCVSALEISLPGSKSDEKNLAASPGMSRPHTPRRHVGASPLNGASSPVEGALG